MSLFRQTTLKISASMPQYLISTSISLELTYYNTYIAKTTMTIRNAAAIMTIMMRMTMMMAPAPWLSDASTPLSVHHTTIQMNHWRMQITWLSKKEREWSKKKPWHMQSLFVSGNSVTNDYDHIHQCLQQKHQCTLYCKMSNASRRKSQVTYTSLIFNTSWAST